MHICYSFSKCFERQFVQCCIIMVSIFLKDVSFSKDVLTFSCFIVNRNAAGKNCWKSCVSFIVLTFVFCIILYLLKMYLTQAYWPFRMVVDYCFTLLQDPVLFIGSLRKNLDPFDKYTDEKLWLVLEQVYFFFFWFWIYFLIVMGLSCYIFDFYILILLITLPFCRSVTKFYFVWSLSPGFES